jgi:ankyrin repeat protein
VTRVLDSPPDTVTAEQLLNTKDDYGKIALASAADKGHRDLVALLLDRGAGDDDDGDDDDKDDDDNEDDDDDDNNDDDDDSAVAQISRPRTTTASRPLAGRR